ncbi:MULTISPECIES: SufE family protein [unclassified Roseibium]|uniref:SufE family protein n=1 Tax=unclassified Roseibium TaxID=2629323 RepID=UPI00317E8743
MDTIPEYLDSLKAKFASGSDWNEGLVALLEMADRLPPFAPELKNEETRFHGCQSQIWLLLSHDPQSGRILFAADSDARIVRGLLAIAQGYYQGRTPEEAAACPPSMLRDAGLLDLLAPSRANGFYRLLQHVHAFACEHADEVKETGTWKQS